MAFFNFMLLTLAVTLYAGKPFLLYSFGLFADVLISLWFPLRCRFLFSGGNLPKTAPLSLFIGGGLRRTGYFRNGGRSSGCRVGQVVNPLLGGSKAAELMPKDYHHCRKC